MKTITLPIIVLIILMLLAAIGMDIVIRRRCKALRKCILQNCKDLFDSYQEIRELSAGMRKYTIQDDLSHRLFDIAERERIITASIKQTIIKAL